MPNEIVWNVICPSPHCPTGAQTRESLSPGPPWGNGTDHFLDYQWKTNFLHRLDPLETILLKRSTPWGNRYSTYSIALGYFRGFCFRFSWKVHCHLILNTYLIPTPYAVTSYGIVYQNNYLYTLSHSAIIKLPKILLRVFPYVHRQNFDSTKPSHCPPLWSDIFGKFNMTSQQWCERHHWPRKTGAKSPSNVILIFSGRLTLPLPRVISFKILLQPHHKYYATLYEELDFS